MSHVGQAHCIATTHWSVVLAARDSPAPEAQAALEILCRNYWFPLCAYLRRTGHNPHDAQDLTREFLTKAVSKTLCIGCGRDLERSCEMKLPTPSRTRRRWIRRFAGSLK